jgi:hypothetical protein
MQQSIAKSYGIRRFVWILPVVVSLLWGISIIEILYRHGGFTGNVQYTSYGPSHSRVIDNSQSLPILFNRWMVDPQNESRPETVLGYVCWPAFKIASWMTAGLSKWVPEFRKFSPYGLTYPSYHFMLAILLSLLLWGVVGYVLDAANLFGRAQMSLQR